MPAIPNVASMPTKGAFVLDGKTPQDVAQAIIEGGRQKEPFYIFDLNEAYRRIQHFKDLMPRIKMFYAMKSNDSEMLLKLAISQGLGFDCASPGEINKIKNLNVSPLSIIYAMPTKTPEQMMYARDSGVKHTTFDTLYELKKIRQFWPDARLLIRIRVDSNSLYKLGEKFGCDYETEARQLLDEAAALGLQVAGVAFHVGSACFSMESYEVGLRQAKSLFDYEAKAGRQMKIVDIGGGFLSDRTNRIDEVSDIINSTIEELFPDPSIQVIAEPGRYLCDSAFTLYTNNSNVKRVMKNNKPLSMIYINDGIFGTLRCSEPWHTVEKYKWSTEKTPAVVEEAILYGPSCDSEDRIMPKHEILLPRCTPFDWLILATQGAYTFGFSSKFSCLEIPLMRQVVSAELWNSIKDCPIFDSTDFVVKPDLSSPLPSSLPPSPKLTEIYEHTITPTLKV